MEEKGLLKGPIIRDPSGAAEFIDAEGQVWNVKSFNYSYKPTGYNLDIALNNIIKSIDQDKFVIIDSSYLDEADLNELLDALGILELLDKILVW